MSQHRKLTLTNLHLELLFSLLLRRQMRRDVCRGHLHLQQNVYASCIAGEWKTPITFINMRSHKHLRDKPAPAESPPPQCCQCRCSWCPVVGTPWLWWWRWWLPLPADWTPAAPPGPWRGNPGTPSSCAVARCGPSAARIRQRTPPRSPAHSSSALPGQIRGFSSNNWQSHQAHRNTGYWVAL